MSGPFQAASEAGEREVAPCDVTVVILTFNEARHIGRSIASVRAFARDILVVDSFSTDDTMAIAEAAGARVLQHPFVNYSEQFQWALDQGGIKTAWTLRLDADEVIEPDLAAEIARQLPGLPSDVVGVNFDRKHIFMGRWVRHGGRFPLRLLRLWRTGQGRIEIRWMDEHIVVWGGRTVTFKGGFSDANENDLTFFTAKHNSYATREAIDVLSQRYALFPEDRALNANSTSQQAGLKRWIKEKVYNRLPLWAGPMGYFLYRYIFQLGFLDGRTGTIYHVLQGFWYRYLVACKVYEYDLHLRQCKDTAERISTLSRLSGYDLTGGQKG
ncbi:MAG: glycosyl transferase [Sphingomonadales bacterium 63-6]|nr:MAG: glycosyl transferase [Sphingomonadales bacterium 63-6]